MILRYLQTFSINELEMNDNLAWHVPPNQVQYCQV